MSRAATPVAPASRGDREVVAGPAAAVRVDLATGDLTAPVGGSRDRVLLAGLGPLRDVVAVDDALLLETAAGACWLVRVSRVSGLVAAVEPVSRAYLASHEVGLCTTPT